MLTALLILGALVGGLWAWSLVRLAVLCDQAFGDDGDDSEGW